MIALGSAAGCVSPDGCEASASPVTALSKTEVQTVRAPVRPTRRALGSRARIGWAALDASHPGHSAWGSGVASRGLRLVFALGGVIVSKIGVRLSLLVRWANLCHLICAS